MADVDQIHKCKAMNRRFWDQQIKMLIAVIRASRDNSHLAQYAAQAKSYTDRLRQAWADRRAYKYHHSYKGEYDGTE